MHNRHASPYSFNSATLSSLCISETSSWSVDSGFSPDYFRDISQFNIFHYFHGQHLTLQWLTNLLSSLRRRTRKSRALNFQIDKKRVTVQSVCSIAQLVKSIARQMQSWPTYWWACSINCPIAHEYSQIGGPISKQAQSNVQLDYSNAVRNWIRHIRNLVRLLIDMNEVSESQGLIEPFGTLNSW